MLWLLLASIALLLDSPATGTLSESRAQLESKRDLPSPPLVYPFGGTFKLVLGVSMPISMPGRIFVYSQGFQFQFPLPQNATFFSDYFAQKKPQRRRRRSDETSLLAERSVFYRLLEEEVRRQGGPGRDCLKRSMCEYAESPFQDESLVGEILHVLLTPDYGANSGVDGEYAEAAGVGRSGGDCSATYASCPAGFGLLDHITRVFEGTDNN
ncbi:uncharacterized protein LOC106638593 [Copidosoma floridanum]|uniref:uncharacterized protein LOC106638593 n=1 Tax=Copidosoma floridanum TaxID=29053 RepID=UPI0006C9BFF2|nr:uncharacterized protein LOC106638593 [Copidosoma floridanum]